MPRFSVRWLVALVLILVVGGAFFFCEYLIYFPTILKCAWPKISHGRGGESIDGRPTDSAVRAMVLSDTHLLGAVGGHWFDKLRREWQMERAFQTALWLLRPEIVFILGDIFDEGKWSSQKAREAAGFVANTNNSSCSLRPLSPHHPALGGKKIPPGNSHTSLTGLSEGIHQDEQVRHKKKASLKKETELAGCAVFTNLLCSSSAFLTHFYTWFASHLICILWSFFAHIFDFPERGKHWEDDVRRFHRMFRHSTDTELVVLVGNHDIGFHYEMDWFKLQRFEKVFNASSTRIVTKKGVNFLLVNSVALHGDGCPICQSVEKELIKLSRDLNCSLQDSQSSSGVIDSCEGSQLYPPTPPIMLQHYPLYRVSDAGCTGQDAAPPEERHLLFREKYDVLSKEASQRLLQWFKPRLILSGHTHSGCEVLHDNKYPEISVPSFSWRNRNNPSFILASVSPGSYSLSKCFLPEESTVIGVYCSAGACLLLLFLAHCLWMKGLLQCLSLCLLGKHKSL
ncbi:metallophosphoesterase 1 isoform X1 [Trachinotus anak]|uniref:metallophosphoesterase 1 isoform X1 n=1 Tax=Trachinotus anak TaxID=443729 RepID=UPI0039F1F873